MKVAALGALAAMGAGIADELLSGGGMARASPTGLPRLAVDSTPLAGAPGSPAPSPTGRLHYRTRPDLTPSVISVSRRASGLAPGLIFITPANGTAPDGPLIVTDSGEPIWIRPEQGRSAVNLRVASYRGEPVLPWWEGAISSGLGAGEYVIADTSDREIARVRAGNGYQGDLHEFVIGPDDTAFFLVTNPVDAEAPSASGPARRALIEGVVQEVDIASGRVLFEWHSLPAIDPMESYLAVPDDGSAYDYLHLNSIDIDSDGGLLLSGRHTWAVYKLDHGSSAITWRLNGRRSDFTLEPAASFAWQHDARRQPDGSLSIFDDGAMGPPPQFETRSRGIVLDLDTSTMRAWLVRAFSHPDGVLATSQGSLQLLPNGDAFVGWGSVPRFSEFDRDGALLLDASFASANQSYRALRFPWIGRPADRPVVAAVRSPPPAGAVVYASWNGATEVASWEVLGGSSDDRLAELGGGPRVGFETAIPIASDLEFVAVRALDAQGRELGLSDVITVA